MSRLRLNTPVPKHEAGFTVVEVVLALTVAIIMAGVLVMVTFRFFANAIQSQQTAELALESQTLLGQVTEDLRLATGVGATNQLSDTNQPSGWSTSDTNNVLIITAPAVDSSRNIIYDPNTGFPYENEFIYYISNKVMYKRTLKNNAATGNVAITTCPAASSTASCPADSVFSENVDNIAFIFYDLNNTEVADATASRSVQLSISLSKKVFAKTISLANTTRVTQRNR